MSTLKSAATKIAEAIEYVNESGILPEDSRAQLREVELSVSSAFDFFTDKLNETPALNQEERLTKIRGVTRGSAK